MSNTILLAVRNFRKSIGQYVSFGLIILLSSVIFSSAMTIQLNIGPAFDKKFKDFEVADAFFSIDKKDSTQELLDQIDALGSAEYAETREGIMLNVPTKVGGSTQDQDQVFYNMSEAHRLNSIHVMEEVDGDVKNPLYITYGTYATADYVLGDKYEFKSNGRDYSFTIKGVVDEMQNGDASQNTIGVYLTSESYEYLRADNESNLIEMISVKSPDGASVYDEIHKLLTSENIDIINQNNYELSKDNRLMIANLIVMLLLIFSTILMLISLLVSKFKIENGIEEEMPNMGVLKALGYTSSQIKISVVLPYLVASVVGTLLGISLSYALIPVLISMVAAQSAFFWAQGFDLVSGLITFLLITFLVWLFCYRACRKIKRLNAIYAIRGLDEQKEKKNRFEFDRTKGSASFVMMLKNMVNSARQNVLLGIVVFCLSFLGCFVGILFYNINVDSMNFANALMEEYPTVAVYTNGEDLRAEFEEQKNVEIATFYSELETVIVDDIPHTVLVAENYDHLNNDMVYEGRNPENQFELSVGSEIKDSHNLKIGDKFMLEKHGARHEFEIVGFLSSVNTAGEIFEMTNAGYERMDTDWVPNSIYVYLEDESRSKEFIDWIDEFYSDEIAMTINYHESINAGLSMYTMVAAGLCVVMAVLAIFIISLILYVVISTILVGRRKELGVLKALGYKNSQLIFQTAGSFVISTFLAVLAALFFSGLFLDDLFAGIFRSIGAMKLGFEYPVFVLATVGAIVIASTITVAWLQSRKIKKIEAYNLITE